MGKSLAKIAGCHRKLQKFVISCLLPLQFHLLEGNNVLTSSIGRQTSKLNFFLIHLTLPMTFLGKP
jgi:hypothetical protein